MIENQSKVFINGEKVFSGVSYHVEIHQTLGEHNTFSLRYPTSSVEGFGATLMDGAIE